MRTGNILARLVAASHAAASARWGDEDIERYARALAALAADAARSYDAETAVQRQVAARARALG